MDFTLRLLVSLSVATSCLGQYYEQGAVPAAPQGPYQPQERYYREPLHTAPPPQIISHKQAQNHNGDFKYAFAAENGLVQGEYIAPDGSRNGGYTYVDPNGKKISVKYTAGKEGFRIIEGDHIPKAPPQTAAVPHPGYASSAQPVYNYQPQGQYDDGQYRPEKYERPQTTSGSSITFRAPHPQYAQPQPRFPAPIQRPEVNSLEDKGAYTDEPGKPHSFGAGYSFEFGG